MASDALQVGATGTVILLVEERHCTRRGDYRIFSTPNMVQLLENAAIEALAPCLEPGQISVGARVELDHMAPTLLGMSVTAQATVREVDGARVRFDVTLHDGVDQVGKAVHDRYVLDGDRYFRRLAKKGLPAQM